jgi:predicted membrane protein
VNSDSVKAAKARALVATLLFLEAGVIFALALWLVGLTIFADSFEVLPLLGVLLFALLGSGGLAISAIGYRKRKVLWKIAFSTSKSDCARCCYIYVAGAVMVCSCRISPTCTDNFGCNVARDSD